MTLRWLALGVVPIKGNILLSYPVHWTTHSYTISTSLGTSYAHSETSPPVLWTGKIHSCTGWTGNEMVYLLVILGHGT